MRERFRFLRHWTFKRKLMLFSLFISTVPVIMLGIVSAYLSGKSIQEETDRNHQIILRQVQRQIDNILVGLDTLSLQLANDPAIARSMERGISMEKLETLEATLEMLESVRLYRSYNGSISNLSLIYEKYGQVYSSQHGVLKLSDFPYAELLKTEMVNTAGSFIIPPNTYAGQNEYLIMRPVSSDTSVRPIGRVVLHIKLSLIYEAFHSANLGAGRELVAIDGEGRIAISSNLEEIGTQLPQASDLYHYWKNPGTTIYRLNGEEHHLSLQQSSYNHWAYIAVTPLKETTAKSDQIRLLTGLIVCCIILLWMLIALLGSRKLYRPIHMLFARLSVGDRGKGDLKLLGDYIDNMVHNNTRLEDRWNEQLPNLKDNALLKLLRGDMSEREYDAIADPYSISLQGNCYYVCVLKIDDPIVYRRSFQAKDRTLVTYAFSRLVEEISREMESCEAVIPVPGQVVILFGAYGEDGDPRERMVELCDMIRCKVSGHFNVSITAAVSEGIPSITDIPHAYEQALQLLRNRPLLGHGITLTSESVEHPASIHEYTQSFIQSQKAIVASITNNQAELAGEYFVKMTDEASRYFVTSESMIGMLVFLLGDIEEAIRRKGYDLNAWLDDDLYRSLYAARDLHEAKDWFVGRLFPVIHQRLRQTATGESSDADKRHMLIEQVIAYIHEHFEKDLSLQQIADHFGCSSFQLSRLFKEYKQINFVEYLIRYRMEKAKEWLVHTDQSIKEITERLRYTTTQNFSRVFKQITGMPPGNYRSMHRNS
ncbi:helix-turn-helix domain-containing protein [Paenibacillus sp.]|uniref:helix-turn-helix domain-containing protein n=1 Tax=Paenibacillus sp. TaxID=58172 RepID=UPI002810FE24|nr:helix-turn-helix domain-containing protein [Paenibacillus sp.]